MDPDDRLIMDPDDRLITDPAGPDPFWIYSWPLKRQVSKQVVIFVVIIEFTKFLIFVLNSLNL
jgi:hypothetical protein